MNMIVAVDENWAIGNKGDLLVRIPNDQKMFRNETVGKVVVLGRKTMDTFPQKQPLPKRTNIILTKNKDYRVRDAQTVHSVEELLEVLKAYKTEDICVIGGDSVYQQLLPYCDVAHVTYIEQTYAADRYFPNLDKDPEWVMTAESEEQTYFDLTYYFRRYERVKK